jgi:hypothetical protein
MTSCEGVRLPWEQWEQVFHAPRGGIDASVMANGMENVPPGGRQMTEHTVGKPSRCCFVHLDVNEHYSMDQFIAVTATTEVPALLDLTVTPLVMVVPDVVPGMYADDGWDDVEVPRGPVDPRWHSTVIEFAQTRRYEGVIYEQSFGDNDLGCTTTSTCSC